MVAARLSITAASTLVRDLENIGIFCIFSVYLVRMTSCSAPSQYSSCSFRLNVPFPSSGCLCFSGAFSLAVSIPCGLEKMWGPGFLGSTWSRFLGGCFYSLLVFLSLDVVLSERQEPGTLER